MTHRRWLLTFATVFVLAVPAAQAQTESGSSQYPQNDDQNRSVRRSFPKAVKITARALRGDVIARGRKVARTRGGDATSTCDYDFTVQVDLMSGRRDFTLQPRESDCAMVLDDVRDTNVVERDEQPVAGMPGAGGRVARLFGRLVDALFPTALAQSYSLRQVYHHIYTCGIACAGGIDGLTAQQGWLNYRFNGFTVQMDSAGGWFCTAGMFNFRSNCQPPMDTPGAPMAPVNTGWLAYNAWITGRLWGPGGYVLAQEQTSFFWAPWPATIPRVFEHTLYNQRLAYLNGGASCASTVTGSYVNGPVVGSCLVTNR